MVWLVPIGFVAALPVLKVAKVSHQKLKMSFSDVEKPILKYTFTQILIGFGAGLSIPMLAYYMSVKFSVESGPIGTLNAVVSLIAIPFVFFIPALANRTGTLKAIVIPQFASVPLMILLTFSPSFAVGSFFFIFRQILMNMSGPLMTTFTMRIAKPEQRGTVTAMAGIAWKIPNSIATQVGGVMFDRNLDSPLYATSAIYIVYILVFYTLFKFMEKKDQGR
jgi:MFS family permease